MDNIVPNHVCLVTVTYGERFHLLEQVINSAFEAGIEKAIIVNNASEPASHKALQALETRLAEKVTVIHFSENRGSAGGYKAGLEYADQCPNCEYLWLLDDDNRPKEEALAELCRSYKKLSDEKSRNELILLGLREEREPLRKRAQGEPLCKAFPLRSSFMGFHIGQLPHKVGKRLWPTKKKQQQYLAQVQVPYGPYGGLFFHKDVLTKIGYPDERLFLYADDTEFTFRCGQKGELFLIPGSIIEDIDCSWHIKAKEKNSFTLYLKADSDFRIYYSQRNQVYFERFKWIENQAIYLINKWIYLTTLWLIAQLLGRNQRFSLIYRAIRDGEKENLGKLKTKP